MNHLRSWVAAGAAALLLASACSPTDDPSPLPSTAAAADRFLEAWSEGDMATVSEMMSVDSATEWPVERLDRWWQRRLDEGAITEAVFTREGEPEQPSPSEEATPGYPPVEVGYRVTYSSDAAAGDVLFDGTLRLVFDAEQTPASPDGGERWAVAWEPSLAWPEHPEAAGFDVEAKWPRRGRLLARDGRVLARGAAARRRYPQGSLAGSTIGHIAAVTKKSLDDAPEGSNVGDLIGGSGLEAAFDERLAGTPTTRLLLVDAGGEVVEELGRAVGAPGEDVRTTLDIGVLRAAEQGFGGTVGGAAVIDPASGDILALVDSSAFNPGFYVGVEDLSPFNRAVVGRYPPGSAMKVVTAAAALDSGRFTPESRLQGPAEYKGVRNFESGAFGSVDFATAMKFSVNTAFAQIAERLGGKRMTKYAEAFGFNREIDIPLAHAVSQYPEPEDAGDLMWSAIGQAQVLATPLQMATVAATVANGGKRMEPRIDRDERRRGERVVSRRVARQLTSMMENVVNGGTGVGARLSGTQVAGKTGTAEVDVGGERRNHAWFIAFAPSGAPKVAVAVVAEYGGVGGQVAAPLARQILANVLPVAP